MQNASPDERGCWEPCVVHDPERARDYLFGDGPALALVELNPPRGQVRLVRPVPSPDDPRSARQMEDDRNWLRGQLQNLILTGDSRALLEQEMQFSFFICKLMWLRGLATNQTFNAWSRRFDNREVVETAEHVYERHGDVRLRIDIASSESDLCGPNTRMRQHSDEVVVSLRPVIDALLMLGLWVDRPDERFRELARVMVRLGQAQHRRVGCTEFIQRCSLREQ